MVPPYRYITIKGEGSPDSQLFSDCIGVLFSLSYGIKMTMKKTVETPRAYEDYTVYPLEGVWDLNEKGRSEYDGTFDKNNLVYKLMIRQPDFIEDKFFIEILELTKTKKPHPLLEQAVYETIEEGRCVQMMHLGPYDDEPESFEIMEKFCRKEELFRESRVHREIYLSDFRKTVPEKLKTVLRFKVTS